MTDKAQSGSIRPDENRRELMGLLARSDAGLLSGLYHEIGNEPDFIYLRKPEAGAITLRGRMGGGGVPFNMGEASVTRATVSLAGGEVGHAFILGRDGEKARIAAIIDALYQRDDMRSRIESSMLPRLREAEAAELDRTRAQTAATKVDFFTMVRGED